MTAVAEPSGGGGDRIWHRWGMWLGHYAERAAVPVYAAAVVTQASCWWLPPTSAVAQTLRWPAAALIVLHMMSGHLKVLIHDRNLCLLDLRDEPLTDPQGAVGRHRRQLRLCHRRNWHFAAGVSGVLVMLAVGNMQGWSAPAKLAGTVLFLAGSAVSIYAVRAAHTHNRLQMWCPWCRGGGDDPTSAPTPDPVAVGSR